MEIRRQKKELFGGDYRKTPLWNDALSEVERIAYLLGEMTLEEKFLSLGTGNPAIPRLGIPEFGVGGEGAHGVQARHDQRYDQGEACHTTIFPNPIGMSATWNRELIREAGRVVGREARALFHSGKHRSLSLWAPTVDLNRDPRWGRLEECYGEDGYLTGEMAGAYVDGMQGEDDVFLQCAATAKHFYANNKEEGRTYESSSVDWRNKYEYYLEPYRKLIQEHRLEGVMTAYNEINGVPCMLLKEDLALLKEWGLGHVVCDGGDVGQTVDFHKYFSRHSETVAAGLQAYVDCFTDDVHMVAEAAREAYQHGMIQEKDMDRALFSYFRTMLRLGIFDQRGKNPYTHIPLEVVSCQEHRRLAREVTAESVVLLKNRGVTPENPCLLPLSAREVAGGRESVAVIGPLCDAWNKGWYSGQPLYGMTPWQGIREAVSEAGGVGGLEAHEHLMMETGISEVKIKIGTGKEECYLGIVSDGRTVGAVTPERAEIFLLDRWEQGKVTLQAKSNGKLLALEDDASIGQQGNVTATSDEAFGWFVREMFHINPQGALVTWDHQPLVLDEDGRLRKENMCGLTEREDGDRQDSGEEGCWGTKSYPISWEWLYVKDGIEAAARLAKQADKVVVCLGAHPMITCKEEIDRADIRMAEYQEKMLKRIVEENPNVILAVLSSVPFDISWAQKNVPAILTMATGSMELGRGLADVLFGKASPGGRLSVTWYGSAKDLPPMDDYDVIQGGRTYQYFEGETLYPFGHGLSYSAFAYGSIKVALEGAGEAEKCISADGREKIHSHLSCSLTVTNVGDCCSDEVVQIYVRKVHSELRRPRKVLVYFERLKEMKPGEERVVSFCVALSQLEYFDVIAGKMMLEPGCYELMAGASSKDIRKRRQIVLEGEERGVRDGAQFIAADCFDRAAHHVLRRGHLSYQSVCTKNSREEIVLTYERMMVKTVPKALVLDFWQEYFCEIEIDVDGQPAGYYELEDPFGEKKMETGAVSERRQQEVATQAGEATGEGSFEAHQNWLTRKREIGFREVRIPLEKDRIAAGELFALTIRWKGKGKLCMFRFE